MCFVETVGQRYPARKTARFTSVATQGRTPPDHLVTLFKTDDPRSVRYDIEKLFTDPWIVPGFRFHLVPGSIRSIARRLGLGPIRVGLLRRIAASGIFLGYPRVVIREGVPQQVGVIVFAEIVFPRRGVRVSRFGSLVLRRVPQDRRPNLEVDLRRLQADLHVLLVAHQQAQHALGLVPRFAHDGAIRVAHQLAPVFRVGVRHAAQGSGVQVRADGGVDFRGGGLPTEALGAHFGRDEQGVVEEVELGGDHGKTLMVCESAYKCTIGYTLPNRDVKLFG